MTAGPLTSLLKKPVCEVFGKLKRAMIQELARSRAECRRITDTAEGFSLGASHTPQRSAGTFPPLILRPEGSPSRVRLSGRRSVIFIRFQAAQFVLAFLRLKPVAPCTSLKLTMLACASMENNKTQTLPQKGNELAFASMVYHEAREELHH